MEKRKFPRQNLGLEASFVINDDHSGQGIIEDFSQEGMFISFSDASQFTGLTQVQAGAGSSIDVVVTIDGKQVNLPATIVHLTESGMGVAYSGNRFRAYQTLAQARKKIHAVEEESRQLVDGQRITDDGRRIRILADCNGLLREFMGETLQEFFNSLEDNLLKEADRQKNDAAQHPFFDALNYFKRQRTVLPELIIGKLTADANDIAHGRYKPSTATASTGDQSLSLVDKNDFEEWLIIRVVVSRAELQLRDSLIELQLRLDAAFGKENGQRVTNPYSPALIAQALHGGIQSFRAPVNVERLIFRVYQEVVLNRLERLYKELNATLIRHGVLPNLDVTRYLASQAIKQNRDKPAPAPAQPPAETEIQASSPAPAAAASSASAPASAFQSLQEGLARAKHAYTAASNLLKLQRSKKSSEGSLLREQPPVSQIDPQTLQQTIRTLDSVQQQLVQNDIDLDTPGSLVHFLEQQSQAEGIVLSPQEKESAEMVESLFSNIVDHQRIVPDLKPDLRKLEVPILKVLLQDPQLFSSDYHPARQFVNYVALLADRESVNINVNRSTIRNSIHTVLTSALPGYEAFVQGLSLLDKVVEREKKIIERNLARVTEACEGQQRIQFANDRVEKELAERLQGKRIPVPFNELLCGGWKDLMRLCYLREGVESRAWEMTLVVVDQLILRLVPEEYDESKILFKAEELQKLIEKGLSKVPDTKGRNAGIIARIQELLRDGVTGTEWVLYEPQARPEQTDTGQGKAEEDKSLQRWIKRARKLKTGQWLEFDALSDASHLYQIAWIAEQQTRFVFVNHHGMKVADMTLEDLAQNLKSGNMVVLSDAVLPAVENGLDSLVQRIYDQLAQESAHDQLTGLKNRKEFERYLAQSVGRAKMHGQTYVLIYLDIIQFKVINNTCGYEAGDSLLRELGNRIRQVLSEPSVAGRVGGNEFAIIVPVDSEQQGYQIASEIKSALEEKRFVTGGQSFVIETVSSMLIFDGRNDQVLELLRSVESAVAIAKKSGHKEIQIVQPGDARIEERDEVMAWVARINRALDQNTLKLRCQKIAPVVEDGTLPHYEILLTVVDENGEHLPPADFIRAAEEYSRMSAVDRWVIDTVLRWMTQNREQLSRIGGFSINLSGHSMNDDSFLDFMFEKLVHYGVPRDKLIFEVTETTAVSNLEDAADFIQEMRGIGCRFSLDDFGAGQSSYAYLKRLPVDFIKIDGTFVRNIASDDVDYALVKSITEMGHFLNKKIIAEYVSDEAIMEVVKDIGVDYIQGYYLGKPRFIEDLASAL